MNRTRHSKWYKLIRKKIFVQFHPDLNVDKTIKKMKTFYYQKIFFVLMSMCEDKSLSLTQKRILIIFSIIFRQLFVYIITGIPIQLFYSFRERDISGSIYAAFELSSAVFGFVTHIERTFRRSSKCCWWK